MTVSIYVYIIIFINFNSLCLGFLYRQEDSATLGEGDSDVLELCSHADGRLKRTFPTQYSVKHIWACHGERGGTAGMQRCVQRCDYESLQADECASERLMLTETSLCFSLSDATFEMLLSNRTFSLAHQSFPVLTSHMNF